MKEVERQLEKVTLGAVPEATPGGQTQTSSTPPEPQPAEQQQQPPSSSSPPTMPLPGVPATAVVVVDTSSDASCCDSGDDDERAADADNHLYEAAVERELETESVAADTAIVESMGKVTIEVKSDPGDAIKPGPASAPAACHVTVVSVEAGSSERVETAERRTVELPGEINLL